MMERFEINKSRFNIIWLIVGALIGRALGLVLGMDLGFWYFADWQDLLGWQITLGILTAFFYSFLMTSKSPTYLKGAILGAGLGFALVLYQGELKAMNPDAETLPGLANMNVGSGIFFDWILVHLTMAGGFTGMAAGYLINRRAEKVQSSRIPEEPSTA